MKLSTLIITIAALLLLAVTLRLLVPQLGTVAASGIQDKNGQSSLAECPAQSLNCVSSESSDKTTQLARFQISQDPARAMDQLILIMSDLPEARIITQNERYLHVTFTTALMGFTDDVEWLIADDEQTVQVRSASRLGKSDLGANRKRIEYLRTLTDASIQSTKIR